MSTTAQAAPLKVYWQPGCSSCLRTKEFLTKHGVPFVSVNVMADELALRIWPGWGYGRYRSSRVAMIG